MNEDIRTQYPEFDGEELPVCLTYKGGFYCNYAKCKAKKCPFVD